MMSGFTSFTPRKNLLKKITGCGDVHCPRHHFLDIVFANQSLDVGRAHMGSYKILSMRARMQTDRGLNGFQDRSHDCGVIQLYVWSHRDDY